jgi:hypothetical protein
MAMNRRFGSRSISARVKCVRSRRRLTISNGASFAAASSGEENAASNTVISTPRRRTPAQSAAVSATFE